MTWGDVVRESIRGLLILASAALLMGAARADGWLRAARAEVDGRPAVKLTWALPEKAGTFTALRVKRHDFDTAKQPDQLATLPPDAREYVDATGGPDVRWEYSVTAYDQETDSEMPFALPAVARMSTDSEPPAPPTIGEVKDVPEDNGTRVLASYIASPDEEGGASDVVAYRLYRSADFPGDPPTGGEMVGEAPPEEGTESEPGQVLDETATPGSAHWYWLTATNGANESVPTRVIGPVTAVDNSASAPYSRALGFLKTALAIAVTLGLAISFHELGHLLVAKAFHIKADEFAVGFGKVLFSRSFRQTVYSIRAFPLGGFVRVRGMMPDEVHDPDGIYARSTHARVAVIVSGALMNVALAYLLYAAIVAFSFPGTWLGVDKLTPGAPAAAAGIEKGDTILSVNGREYTGWQHTVAAIARSPGKPLDLTVSRDARTFHATVVPTEGEATNTERLIFGLGGSAEKGLIGIRPKDVRIPRTHDPVAVAVWAGRYTRETVSSLLGFTRDLLLGRARVSQTVGGPIAIAQQVHEARREGPRPLTFVAAYLNLCLAVFNLLPFPMLDGMKAIIMIIEGVRGRLFNKEREAAFHFAGLVVLLIMAVLVARMDILRLVGGWGG